MKKTVKTNKYNKPTNLTKHARLVGQLGGRPLKKPASM